MKDPTVDSHACHKAKSGDPSHAGHPSIPPSLGMQLPGFELAAFLAELQREWGLLVALVTTSPCVISLQKLGRSQDVLNGIILDCGQTGHRRSSSAVH